MQPSEHAGLRDVTVVIPTKNRVGVVVGAIDSALAQRDVDVRVIVSDDGSTDGTPERIGAIDDQRVSLLRSETGRGPAAARNAAVAQATTHWVAFLDDDDFWSPDKLRVQLDAMAAQPGTRWSAVACANVTARFEVTSVTRIAPEVARDLSDALLIENVIPAGCSSVLVDRDLFASTGGFAERRELVEDWSFWLRLARAAPMAYVDRPLTAYRVWPRSMSRDIDWLESRRQVLMAESGDGRRSDHVRAQQMIWTQHRAMRAAEAGDRVEAARRYLTAARVGRAPGQLLYAAAALVSPEIVMRRLRARDAGSIPPGWKEEVEGWLLPQVR